ncbi:MAG: O-antigen ligase family protein [Candidatus Eisenbacteria bacterium]|nr:O-antigen ligase family protein [Candidatus Eisenbacteria bacterium]
MPFWIPLALGLAFVFFVPGLLEQFEVPKTEAVRVCGFACMAWAFAAGWGRRAGRVRPLVLIDIAVLAWLAVEIAATVASVSPGLSLFGEPEQREGLLTSLALAGLYAAVRVTAGGGQATGAAPGSRRASGASAGALHVSLEVLAWAAAVASLYAVLQAAHLDPIPWVGGPIYGTYVRPGGTLGHPNLLGVAAASACAIAVAMAVAGARRRALWLGVAMLTALATALSLSRGAWLALAVAAPVAALVARGAPGGGTAPKRATAGAGFAIAAVIVVVIAGLSASGLATPLLIRARELFAPLEGSGRSRLEIWRTALAAWRARPVFGQGPDTFFLVFPRYQTAEYWRQEWGLLPLHAHSIYLHTLATRGVAGLAAGALLVAATIASAWRARRAGERTLAAVAIGALAALGVGGAFGAAGIAGAALAMVLAGALAARDAGARADTTLAIARPPRRAALAIALVATLGAAMELAASGAAAHARLALVSDPRGAAAGAARAGSLMPFDDLYPALRAQSTLALPPDAPDLAARIAEAKQAIGRALALAPLRAIHHQTLGYLLAGSAAPGDAAAIAAAESSFARAVVLAPVDGRLLAQAADLELALGRPARARAWAGRGASLYPLEGASQSALAAACAATGDTTGARVAFERAVAGLWHDGGAGRAGAEAALRRMAAVR